MTIIAVWSEFHLTILNCRTPWKNITQLRARGMQWLWAVIMLWPRFFNLITLIIARPPSAGIMFWPRLQSHHFHHKHLCSPWRYKPCRLSPTNGQFHMWEIPTLQWWPSFVFIGNVVFCRRHLTSNPLTSISRWAAAGLKATKILKRPGLS